MVKCSEAKALAEFFGVEAVWIVVEEGVVMAVGVEVGAIDEACGVWS